jgi:pimeloyl-ACP methyl ester carboxylesterase
MLIPEEHYVKIGPINTCYWAEGQGSPVVLVHGLGGSAAGWLTSFEALSTQHRVYALDLIGHGRTEKPASGRIDYPDLVLFVHDFMMELKIKRASIVGHSMGGAITLQLAINYPDSIYKLVLVDTAGLGRQVSSLLRIMSIPVLGEILASRAYTPDVNKFKDELRSGAKNPIYLTDEILEALYRIEENPTQYKTTLKILRMGVNWMGQKKSLYGPIVQKLPSITCPTLLIWGRQDNVFPFQHGEFAAKTLPDAILETIDDCGHVPMFDQPEISNRLVLEFLRD